MLRYTQLHCHLHNLGPSLPGMFKLSRTLLLNLPEKYHLSLLWILFRLSLLILLLKPEENAYLILMLFLFFIFYLLGLLMVTGMW